MVTPDQGVTFKRALKQLKEKMIKSMQPVRLRMIMIEMLLSTERALRTKMMTEVFSTEKIQEVLPDQQVLSIKGL
jgi:hypothetical protein